MGLVFAILLVPPAIAGAIVGPPPLPDGTITGRVTDAITGAPIAGVQVTPYQHSATWSNGTPRYCFADGTYSMSLPAGDYRLEFLDPAGAHASLGWPSALSVLAATAQTVTVLPWGTTVCDAVMNRAAFMRVQLVTEATGGPVAGANVGLFEQATGSAGGAMTGADGWATKRGLNPGRWRVSGFGAGWFGGPQWYWCAANGSPNVTITADATTTLTIPMRHLPSVYKDVVRKSGPSRYDTALEMAKETFPAWFGVTNLVVASGEDKSLVDALAASGLSGAYSCPLLLVRGTSVPAAVSDAIAAMPQGLRIHIVGGPPAVSDGVRASLAAIPGVVTVDRCSGPTRYETAAQVAEWMKVRLGVLPDTALIANGANPANFYDALALAPLAYRQHFPILLVSRDAVPGATKEALAELGLSTRYIGGGPPAVSTAVQSELGIPAANRLAGSTRYGTAIAIGQKANAAGWLQAKDFAIAATLPDALAAGPMIGQKNGTILLAAPLAGTLNAETAQRLFDTRSSLELGITCGGPNVIPESVRLNTMTAIN